MVNGREWKIVEFPKDAGEVVSTAIFEERLIVACRYALFVYDPTKGAFIRMVFAEPKVD